MSFVGVKVAEIFESALRRFLKTDYYSYLVELVPPDYREPVFLGFRLALPAAS